MDLEQRVRVLEQEVEILKNQIQATLLDIQEQLLTNAYPSLRAEDSAAQNWPVVLPAQPEPIAEKAVQPAALRKVSLNAAPVDEPEQEAEEITPPARHQRQMHVEAPEQAYEAPVVHKASPARLASPTSHDDFNTAELEEWVRMTVEQLGVKHTLELIRATTEQDQITAEARDMLLQLVSAQKRNGSSPTVLPPAQPQTETQQADEEVSQKLILKLIAGVQNAGAGIGRRKKNG